MINKILVTGGYGFIGSAFIRLSLEIKGYEILNIDSLSYAANKFNLKGYENHESYSFLHLDICEKEHIKEAIFNFKPNWILNFAAESHVDNSIDSPEIFFKSNVQGVLSLLISSTEFYQNLNNSDKERFRFIQVSTDEVFGDLGADKPAADENSLYCPSSPYSASKASADHLVTAWNRTYSLPTIITNCSNNYGPNQHQEKLIPLMIHHALTDKNLPIYGDGKQIRDWIFVNDHCSAIMCILRSGKTGESYNIGGNTQKTNLEVVNTICTILDELKPLDKPNSYKQQIIHIKDRLGHDTRYALDSSKLHSKLGWEPSENFSDGIRKTINWYVENQIFFE